MRARALVLTYHAIEPGPPPLCIDPSLFRAHLELIAAGPARALSLDELAAELRDGGPRRPSVAVTFDDGFASVAERAAPMLMERGIPATVFCVTGHLGGVNDFPTARVSGSPRRLAGAEVLADLGSAGIDLGSHGMSHAPLELADDDPELLRREIVDSRRALEERTGCPVRWFALPYGSPAGKSGRSLIERSYEGACETGPRVVRPGADPYRLPRVDAHYLRRPRLLRRALEGGGAYLGLRRMAARARRRVRQDFVAGPL